MRLSLPQFPNSTNEPFLVTSPETTSYNCIAWAYGDDTKWYWPDSSNSYYWPENVPREETIDSFILLFKNIGFEICTNEDFEPGYNKIAIYCNNTQNPTHAARQLETGLWTSKLGPYVDVSHTLYSLSNGSYGNVIVFMKRKIEYA